MQTKASKITQNWRPFVFTILILLIAIPNVNAEPPVIAIIEEILSEDSPYKEHNFELRDQNGKTINLKDLEGNVVFINFWATWCSPCIAEMPDIDDLYQTYKEADDVMFVMVSLDQNFDKAKDFLNEKEFDFNIYKPQSSIPKEFQSRGIPNTFVLGKNGEIAFSKMGMGQWNTIDFKEFIEELRSKPSRS